MPNDGFSHLDDSGNARMVDVGEKEVTLRVARASARLITSPVTVEALRDQRVPKGDVFATARIAGILAAKKTGELIPLAHPLGLDHVDVELTISGDRSIDITASASCRGRTGVEMEAMTACSIAALTVYDMCKSLDREMAIEYVRLEEKSGGRSGTWRRAQGVGAGG